MTAPSRPTARIAVVAVMAVLAAMSTTAPTAAALGCTPISDFPAPPPNAPLPGSCFEGGDGDQVDPDGPTPGSPAAPNRLDWGSAEVTAAAQKALDYVQGAADSQFTGGSEENPDSWTWNVGSLGSNKYDLISGYSYQEPGTQDLMLSLAFVRESNNGASWLAFELNQKQPGWKHVPLTGAIPAQSLAVPTRSTGDLLVTYSVSNNNSPKPVIGLCRWLGDEKAGTWTSMSGAPVTSNCPALGPAVAQADMNGAGILAADNHLGAPAGLLEAGRFGEASVNLSEAFKAAGANPGSEDDCLSFGYFWAHSRSSEPITSAQQDFILPRDAISAANCAVEGTKWHDKNGNGLLDGVDSPLGGWTIYADYDGDGVLDAGEPSDVTAPRDADDLRPTGTYTLTDLADGTYPIREVAQSGWQCTSPSPCSSEVTMTGTAIDGVDFLNFDASPAIKLTKANVLNAVGPPKAGDKITYSFEIENTGNLALAGVDLDDDLLGFADVACDATTALAVGAKADCTGEYTLTQADVDAGKVDNSAKACGDSPAGVEVCSTDTTSTLLAADPKIALDKAAVLDADGTITYTFEVSNTGNVTLDGVDLDDALVGLSDAVCDAIDTLAPGASTTCARTYTPTQADIDAGKVDNSADACGDSPEDVEVCATDTTTTPLPAHPGIELEKTGVLNAVGPPKAGDTVTYTFEITNTGNVTLTGADLDDALVGFADADCGAATLAPAAKATCTAEYTLTQTDVDAGRVINTATACADSPAGSEVCDEDTTTTDLEPSNGILVEKDGPAAAYHGDLATYTFLVSNAGSATLSAVRVADDKCADVHGPVRFVTGDDDTKLEVGERWRYTCTMTIGAHAEGEANPIVNTVSATATDPKGGSHADTDTHETRVLHAAVQLDKTGPGAGEAGASLQYALVVTNPGDTPLTGQKIAVTDSKCNSMPVLIMKRRGDTEDATPDTLDPGDAWVYTCTVQTAVGEPSVINVASVQADDVNGRRVADDDAFTTPLTQPKLQVLPATVVSGGARLRGPASCVSRSFLARVTGRRIKKVVWFVDDNRVKTFRSRSGEATRANLRVDPTRYGKGVHRLRARITFASQARTDARTLRMTFQECANLVIAPKFTG